MPYQGREDATSERVRNYLRDHYSDTDGTPLTDARLAELMTDHAGHLTKGESLGSFAHYVGDQIAEAAGLPYGA